MLQCEFDGQRDLILAAVDVHRRFMSGEVDSLEPAQAARVMKDLVGAAEVDGVRNAEGTMALMRLAAMEWENLASRMEVARVRSRLVVDLGDDSLL